MFHSHLRYMPTCFSWQAKSPPRPDELGKSDGRQNNNWSVCVVGGGGLILRGENVGRIEQLISCSELENLKTMCHYMFQNDALQRWKGDFSLLTPRRSRGNDKEIQEVSLASEIITLPYL